MVELRAGGSCPGNRSVACNDDPDIYTIIYTNVLLTYENVYYTQVTCLQQEPRRLASCVTSCKPTLSVPIPVFYLRGWIIWI